MQQTRIVDEQGLADLGYVMAAALAGDSAVAQADTQAGIQANTPAPQGLCIYLNGDLGAGKTTMARSVIRALGAVGPIKSPSYTIVETYELDVGLVMHLDLYRLHGGAEVVDLGLEGAWSEAVLVFVEWPERGQGAIPDPDLCVELGHQDDQHRTLQLRAVSRRGEAFLSVVGL